MISKKVVLVLAFIFALVQIASAQYFYDQGFSGFSLPFFNLGYFDLLEFYNQNYVWIDFFVVLAVLGGVIKKALEDKLGKVTPAVLAVILSFGFASIERTWNFNLLAFGPVAFLMIALAVLFSLLWLVHHVFQRGHGVYGEYPKTSITTIALIGFLVLGALAYLNYSNAWSIFGDYIRSPLAWIIMALVIGIIFWIIGHYRSSSGQIPFHDSVGNSGDYMSGSMAGPRNDVIGSSGDYMNLTSTRNEESAVKNIKDLINEFASKVKDQNISLDSLNNLYKEIIAKINDFSNNFPYSGYRSTFDKMINEVDPLYKNRRRKQGGIDIDEKQVALARKELADLNFRLKILIKKTEDDISNGKTPDIKNLGREYKNAKNVFVRISSSSFKDLLKDYLNELYISTMQIYKYIMTNAEKPKEETITATLVERPTDKNYKERELYEIKSRLQRAIKNAEDIPIKNLQQVVSQAESVLNKYYSAYIPEPEAGLINQLNAIIQKLKITSVSPTEVSKERELYLLRGSLIKRTNENVAYLNELINKPGVRFSELADAFESAYTFLSENKEPLKQIGGFDKFRNFLVDYQRKMDFKKLGDEEKKQLEYEEKKSLPYKEALQIGYDPLSYVENELDRLRRSYRGRNLSDNERNIIAAEKNRLIKILENLKPESRAQLIKRNSLLGGLRNGLE